LNTLEGGEWSRTNAFSKLKDDFLTTSLSSHVSSMDQSRINRANDFIKLPSDVWGSDPIHDHKQRYETHRNTNSISCSLGDEQRPSNPVYFPMLPQESADFIEILTKERGIMPKYLAVMEASCKRLRLPMPTSESPYIVMCDTYHVFLISGKKVRLKFHIDQVLRLHSFVENALSIEFRDSSGPMNVDINVEFKLVGSSDEFVRTLLSMWDYNHPKVLERNRPFSVVALTDSRLLEPIYSWYDLPYGGFLNSYLSACMLKEVPSNRSILEHIEIMDRSGSKIFSLSEYPNPSHIDTITLIKALQHNTYFMEIRIQTELKRDAIFALLDVLESNKTAKTLIAPGIGLTGNLVREWQHISKKPPVYSPLTHIDLSRNSLDDRGTDFWCEVLANSYEGLISINLSQTSLSGHAIAKILHALASNCKHKESLRHLDLSRNSMDSEACSALASWLWTPNKLKSLNLAETDCLVNLIGTSMREGCNDYLEILDLAGNELKDASELLNYCRMAKALHTLHVSSSIMSSSTIIDLVKALAFNESLPSIHLGFRGLHIGPELIETIVAIMGKNITSLDLSENPLGDEGLYFLFSGLSRKDGPVHLVLNESLTTTRIMTSLRRRSIESFCSFLRENRSLKRLELRGSQQKSWRTDLVPVIESLCWNETLEELDISGQFGGDGIAVALSKILLVNKTLKRLYWDNNETTSVGFKRFWEGFKRNSGLLRMHMPLNDVFFAVRNGDSTFLRQFIYEIEARLSENQRLDQKRQGMPHDGNVMCLAGKDSSVSSVDFYDLFEFEDSID
jgi:hypothetical protein